MTGFIITLIYAGLVLIYFTVLMAGRKDKELNDTVLEPDYFRHTEPEELIKIWEAVLISIFWLPALVGALVIGLVHKVITIFKRK